jgi:hypothetical protein
MRVSVLATVAGVVLASVGARAQDAAGLADQAERDARAGRYVQAVKAYKRAWELSKDPAYLFNVSIVSLEGLKDPLDAWEWAQQYSEAVKTDKGRQEAEQLVKSIEQALAPGYGRVTLDVKPANAELYLDSRLAERRIPRRVAWVEPGEHVVLASAPGCEPGEARFAVKAGGRASVTLALAAQKGTLRVESRTPGATVAIDGDKPAPAPVEKRLDPGSHAIRASAPGHVAAERKETLAPGATLVVQVDLAPEAGPAVGIAAPPPPAAGMSGQRVAGAVLMGVGAAALVAGGGLYGGAYKVYSDANGLIDPEYTDKVNLGKRLALGSYISMGVGGAALLTGIIVYVTGPADAGVSIAPAGPEGPGATVSFAW